MLKPKKKLTRREIKEDKFVTTYAKVTKYLETHSKVVYAAAAAVVVTILAVSLIRAGRRAAEGKAAVELARGLAAYERLDYTAATDILRTAVEDYGGTRNGTLALLHLGNVLYQQGQYAEARRYYEKFARKVHSIEYLAAAGRAAVAECLEQEGKYSEAAQRYEKVARDYDTQPTAPRYLLAAGRCYALAGMKDQAERVLRSLLDKYPEAQERTQAELVLGEVRS
ncbi:MAG: tetratricopeptide repeat protein [candidate division KSB1 bacterium]|nr:tetratricopeptide repeat protein [candidate division KSB1 bacterium]